MALDRSKFKATSVAANKQKAAAVESAVGRQGFGERADLHKMNDGINVFRIYPPHPSDRDDATFYEPVARVFLPAMVEDKDDDGKVKMEGGKPVLKRISKPIFNSKVHGGTEKDLVEEYVTLGKQIAEATWPKKEDEKKKNEFIAKLVGKFSKNANERLPGLLYKTSYVMYADRIENGKHVKFARLEVGIAVKDGMEAASAVEGVDEAIAVDPWTDPETGRAVQITYNKQAQKPGDYYKVIMDPVTVPMEIGGKKVNAVREFPLSDEQLENFLKFDSLAKMFRNSFKKKDFEWQLKGLEIFDKEYKLGIFDTEEFAAIVEEIAAYYEDETEEDQQQVATTTSTTTTGGEEEEEEEIEEAEEEEADDLTLMSRVELKNLKKAENLDIKILTSDSDDQLRDKIRAARKASAPLTEEPLPGEEGYVEPEKEEKVVEKPVAGGGAKDRLAALRKKTS